MSFSQNCFFCLQFQPFTSTIHSKAVFPGGSVDKESTCNAEEPGLIRGSGRSPGVGDGNPLQ